MIFVKEYGIAYAPVPKNACTTIKTYLFGLQNNFPFKEFKAGSRTFHIHKLMPSTIFEDWNPKAKRLIERKNIFKFAVVRDPISRILSCYSNRVLHHKDIQKNPKTCKKLSLIDLPTEPSLNVFVSNLEEYIMHSPSICHHGRPQVDYLGTDINRYSKIYPVSLTDTVLMNDLLSIVGEMSTPLPPRRLQTGGKKFTIDDLEKSNIEKIINFYKKDYEVFGSYFNI